MSKKQESAASMSERETYKLILSNPEKARNKFTGDRGAKLVEIIDIWDSISQPTNVEGGMEKIYIFSFSRRGKLAVLPGHNSLHDLHKLIYDYYNFEPIHAYGFFMNNKAWSTSGSYYNPDMEGRSATEVKIANLNLYPDKNFLYIYDFGSSHKVKMTFNKVVEINQIKDYQLEDLPAIISKSKVNE